MYEREQKAAVEAVRMASVVCRAVRRRFVEGEALAKDDRSPVTVADFASQAVVNAVLGATFPGDPIVAEEDASALRADNADVLRTRVHRHVREVLPDLGMEAMLGAIDAGAHVGGMGRYWVLDPIDGTKGFIRGDQYAVALALMVDGVPVVGVLGCPNLPAGSVAGSVRGCVLVAARGEGCREWVLEDGAATPVPVRVAVTSSAAAATMCESFESGHTAHGASERITARLGIAAQPVRMDSQCKYAAIARGDADIYLRIPTSAEYREKIWDHAAGVCVVTEAGGRVTDVHGAGLDFTRGRTLAGNAGVVATNGRVHADVLAGVMAEI